MLPGNNTEGVILFLLHVIFGAKFEEQCSIISRDILDSVFYCSSGTIYDVITFLIYIIQKRKSVSRTNNDIPKRKTPFLFYFEKLLK